MGIIKQGILGGFSGKVGSVVGSSWKGIAVMKAKPLSVANPKTTAQVNQRTKFSTIIVIATQLLASVIKPLWDRFALRQSGYNAFISANIAVFDNLSSPDWSSLVISKGKMPATPILTAGPVGETDVQVITFDPDDSNTYSSPSDLAYGVFLYESSEGFKAISATANRSDGEVNFGEVNDVEVLRGYYLAFKRQDGTVVSNTSFYD